MKQKMCISGRAAGKNSAAQYKAIQKKKIKITVVGMPDEPNKTPTRPMKFHEPGSYGKDQLIAILNASDEISVFLEPR